MASLNSLAISAFCMPQVPRSRRAQSRIRSKRSRPLRRASKRSQSTAFFRLSPLVT
jgi:hypothetical protein